MPSRPTTATSTITGGWCCRLWAFQDRHIQRVPLKQKISEAEAEIERINGIISKIDTALALPDLFTRDPKQAAQLSKARAGAANALQRAEEEWLAASSQYDEATG